MATNQAAIDQAKLEAFLGTVVGDFGAAISAALVAIGDRLGLYRAMAAGGPVTPAELAARTGTVERYVREWLINQAAGGYVAYDPATGRYTLPPEQALALTDESSPFFVGGGFEIICALMTAQQRVGADFRIGRGMAWGEHDPALFEGTERFFRPGYAAHLTTSWLPALEGVVEKLERGAVVGDVGCGHGASTIIMAQAYPRSRFIGFDSHPPSIERARELARQAGVAGRATFDVALAGEFPGADRGYDLVAFFDCLHDMGEPIAAVRRARETLDDDGTVLLVEPMAGKWVEENFNPIGRIFSAASTLVCTPNALATGGQALGAVASDQSLEEVFRAAGFGRFRRAAETPFNRIFEARP